MDDNTPNATTDLVRAILGITAAERYSVSKQSICQDVRCIFSLNDHDYLNRSCRVTPPISAENPKENLSLPLIAKYIQLYIYPLFIFMGIFGNGLSCFIMFMNVRRSVYPTSLYLTVLAFVDCLYLSGSALPHWISQINHTLDIKLLSDYSCRLVYWFGHFTTHLSAGLVVGVTVERFIAVQYPLIAHKINTVNHTRIVLTILISFFILLNSPVLILVKLVNEPVHIVLICKNDTSVQYTRDEKPRCILSNQRYEQPWVYVDFAVYTLIPFLLIVTLNCLIIRRLIDAQHFRQRMVRFNNNTSRYDQQEIKHRHYSDSHEAIELLGAHSRHSRRFRTVLETQPLAVMLRPQSSQVDERRLRYNTKQSSISTELSTLSFELKARSNHRFEIYALHHKSILRSNSNNTRLTILLLFVSCSFLVLTLPAVALNLIMSMKLKSRTSTLTNDRFDSVTTGTSKSDTIFYYTIARLLMIINHSINFILYFVLGKRFRRDLKQLFLGYWKILHRRRHSNK